MSTMLSNFQNGSYRDILTVGVVGTLLNGWLLPRLPRFSAAHSGIDLRLNTNNNRADEWAWWFAAAGLTTPPPRGWMFDSSVGMVAAVIQNSGVGLVPVRMFAPDIAAGRILQPFPQTVVTGRYWLTWLKSREENPVMQTFHRWLVGEIRTGSPLAG